MLQRELQGPACGLPDGLGRRGLVAHGGGRAPWTVVFQPGGGLEPSCLNRTVRVIPVDDLVQGAENLRPWCPHLQTVGVARLGGREDEILALLARMGVSRITGLAQVAWPPPWWHHDGTGPLQGLVRWTDVEGVE